MPWEPSRLPISPALAEWITRQHVFFVGTAPSGDDGHINVSPKGLDTFRVLGDNRVAYLDLTGSGVETIAHLRDNGRITVMLCSFEGPPRIVRLYGRGHAIEAGDPRFAEVAGRFDDLPGTRSMRGHRRRSGGRLVRIRRPADVVRG